MLYNNGDNFQLIYYQGKPVSQIWKNGRCVYPGFVEDVAYFKSGNTFNSFTITYFVYTVEWSDNPPPTGFTSYIASDPDSPHRIYYWYTTAQNKVTLHLYTDASNVRGSEWLLLAIVITADTYTINYITDISAFADIDLHNTIKLDNCFYFYNSLTNLTPISNWDVSNVQSFAYMFYRCGNLDLTKISYWDFSSALSISGIFNYSKIQSLNGVGNWDVSNVTDISYMCYQCYYLSDISALSTWTTSSVINMEHAFSECRFIDDLSALSTWDTGNVTTFDNMFSMSFAVAGAYISDLTPLRNWDTHSALYTREMFIGNPNISTLSGLENWDTSNLIDISDMFSSCHALTDISALANWDVSNVTQMVGLFSGCNISDYSSISNWNVSNVVNMSSAFAASYTNSDLTGLANWDVSHVTNMSWIFADCTDSIHGIESWDVSSVMDLSHAFDGNFITNVDALANWNITNVRILSNIFESCFQLTDISVLVRWKDLPKVVNIDEMFINCTTLSDLTPLKDWNVSNVTRMNGLFSGCINVTDISPILDNWDFSGARTLYETFYQSGVIKADFSKVTTNIGLNSTFMYCDNLTICDLGSYVSTLLGFVFDSCQHLSTLVIRKSNSIIPLVSNDNFLMTALASSQGKVYVPQRLITNYQNNSMWNTCLWQQGCQLLPLEGSPYEQPGSI